MAATPAVRRFSNRVGIAMGVYLFGHGVLVPWFARALHPDGLLLVFLAVLSALPLLGVVAATGLYLREERDEYIRVTAVKVLLSATAFMLCVATVWGFLEAFGSVPHVPAYFTIVVWAVGLLVGNIWWKWPE